MNGKGRKHSIINPDWTHTALRGIAVFMVFRARIPRGIGVCEGCRAIGR